MADANLSKESYPSPPHWPLEPEELLGFVPPTLEGSPYELLYTVITRAHGIVAVLAAVFAGRSDYRPSDTCVMNALWAAQGHLNLARQLLERLEVANV